jgi:hypothetical protein
MDDPAASSLNTLLSHSLTPLTLVAETPGLVDASWVVRAQLREAVVVQRASAALLVAGAPQRAAEQLALIGVPAAVWGARAASPAGAARAAGAAGAAPHVLVVDVGELAFAQGGGAGEAALLAALMAPTGAYAAPGGHLVAVDDVGALAERCESLAAAAALLARIAAGAAAAKPRGFVSLRCDADADWALGSDSGLFAIARVSLLESLARASHALVRVGPLPTGFSREVHGRVRVETRSAQPAGAREALFRVGSDGKTRVVGDVKHVELRPVT